MEISPIRYLRLADITQETSKATEPGRDRMDTKYEQGIPAGDTSVVSLKLIIVCDAMGDGTRFLTST